MSSGGAQDRTFGPFFDNNGAIYRGIKVLVTETGTTSAKTYWTDEAKTVPVASGVLTDSDNDGIARAYFDGDYRFRVTQSNDSALDTAIDWDTNKVTSDTATMWEGNFGTTYPTASAGNIWQQFALTDASSNLLELGINTGSSFSPLIDYVNIEWFGADPTGVADSTSAIQAAIDTNVQLILVPEGTYKCNVTVDGRVNIVGTGPRSILKANTVASPVITVTANLDAALSGQGLHIGRRFSDFTLQGVTKQGKGILYTTVQPQQNEIERVYFDNFDFAIDWGVDGAISNKTRYCSFKSCDYGVYGTDGTSGALNNNEFKKNVFGNVDSACVYLDGTTTGGAWGNEFNRNWLEGNDGFGIVVRSLAATNLLSPPNEITNGWIESTPQELTVDMTAVGGGATDTPYAVWVADTVLQVDYLVKSFKADNASVLAQFYAGWASGLNDDAQDITGTSTIDIDESIFNDSGSVFLTPTTPKSAGSLVVRRPRTASGLNAGVIVEGLPMMNPVSDSVYTVIDKVQDLTVVNSATLAYQGTQHFNSGVILVTVPASTDEVIGTSFTATSGKSYALTFEARASTTSIEEDITIEITGTGTMMNEKTIYARGDRWTSYVMLQHANSTVTNQVLRFGTTADSTFLLSRLQLLEFDSQIQAEEFVHKQNYAISSDDKAIHVLADSATPSVITDEKHSYWSAAGTTGITNLTNGFIGQMITIVFTNSIVFTDGTNIFLSGGAFTSSSTDTLTLIQFTDGKWYEVSRGDNGA